MPTQMQIGTLPGNRSGGIGGERFLGGLLPLPRLLDAHESEVRNWPLKNVLLMSRSDRYLTLWHVFLATIREELVDRLSYNIQRQLMKVATVNV